MHFYRFLWNVYEIFSPLTCILFVISVKNRLHLYREYAKIRLIFFIREVFL